MDRDAILSKVVEVIAETLDTNPEEIGLETEFKALGADSFDLLELITAFEEELETTMDDEALGQIQTVADVVAAVEAAQ